MFRCALLKSRHLLDYKYLFVAVLILTVAAGLRLWHLGTKSVWFDEAYSVYVATQSFGDIPRLLARFDTHPPLHYLLLHVWIAFWGSGEIAIRLLSVLAGLGTVFFTFLLGRDLGGIQVGILGSILTAVSPYHIAASQDARMYPLLGLFVILGFYGLHHAIQRDRRWGWALYAIAMLGSVYTHHFAWSALIGQACYFFLTARRAHLRPYIISTGGLVLGSLPLIPFWIFQFETVRIWPDIRPPFDLIAVTDLLGMFSFGGTIFGFGTYFQRGPLPLALRPALLAPFVLLLLAGILSFKDWRSRCLVVGYWAVPIGIIVLISLTWKNVYYERYFSFLMPAFAIALASGAWAVANYFPGKQQAVMLLAAAGVPLAFIVPSLVQHYHAPSHYDWRAAAKWVEERASPDDFVLFIPAFARVPFEYYFDGPQDRRALNPREAVRYRDKVQFQTDVNINTFVEIARRHPRMWIVATIPIGYEARMQIADRLAPYYQEIEGRRFGMVFVFLWHSKIHATGGGS